MVNYKLVYTKQAPKDAKKLSRSQLKTKALELLEILQDDPLKRPPEYEAWSVTYRALTLGESIFSIAWSTKYTRKRRS